MTENFKTVSLIILTAIISGLVVIVGLVLMILASESALAAESIAVKSINDAWWLIGIGVFVLLFADHKWHFILTGLLIGGGISLLLIGHAKAQENWWQRPAIMACCSEADAVYADEWTIHPDGSVSAVVTGGGPRGHAWAPIGRRYEVPADKIRDQEGNPTGRPLLFINPNNLPHVYCFVPGVMT